MRSRTWLLGSLVVVAIGAAMVGFVLLSEPRTWIDGFPVGAEIHCHDDACRAAISHVAARRTELEPGGPEVVGRRTFSPAVRDADGSRPILRTRGQEVVVALSLADGSSRLRLVSCGRFWSDEPYGCTDWSLPEVEALFGDQ